MSKEKALITELTKEDIVMLNITIEASDISSTIEKIERLKSIINGFSKLGVLREVYGLEMSIKL